eukprot:1818396-Rhodomonas_salina.6
MASEHHLDSSGRQKHSQESAYHHVGEVDVCLCLRAAHTLMCRNACWHVIATPSFSQRMLLCHRTRADVTTRANMPPNMLTWHQRMLPHHAHSHTPVLNAAYSLRKHLFFQTQATSCAMLDKISVSFIQFRSPKQAHGYLQQDRDALFAALLDRDQERRIHLLFTTTPHAPFACQRAEKKTPSRLRACRLGHRNSGRGNGKKKKTTKTQSVVITDWKRVDADLRGPRSSMRKP